MDLEKARAEKRQKLDTFCNETATALIWQMASVLEECGLTKHTIRVSGPSAALELREGFWKYHVDCRVNAAFAASGWAVTGSWGEVSAAGHHPLIYELIPMQ